AGRRGAPSSGRSAVLAAPETCVRTAVRAVPRRALGRVPTVTEPPRIAGPRTGASPLRRTPNLTVEPATEAPYGERCQQSGQRLALPARRLFGQNWPMEPPVRLASTGTIIHGVTVDEVLGVSTLAGGRLLA